MLRSFALMAVLTIAWGMNWSVMKIGVTELPPLWFRSIGLVLGTLLLGFVLAIRSASFRIPPNGVRRIAAVAVPNIVVWYVLVTVAITMLPAGRAAILGFTMPAWAALIGVVVHREPLDVRTGVGVACAVLGVVLLVAGDWHALSDHPLGTVLMLVAAISWAWGTHALKRTTLPMETLVLTFWMMAFACPIVVGASAFVEGARWRVPVGVEWWPILYNAVLVLAIGNLIWFTVARTLSATSAGLSTMLIPVVGVFSGVVLLGEAPSWRDYAALVLICVAVGAAILPKRQPLAAR